MVMADLAVGHLRTAGKPHGPRSGTKAGCTNGRNQHGYARLARRRSSRARVDFCINPHS